MDRAYPKALRRHERERLSVRRHAALDAEPAARASADDGPVMAVGFGLSGGGIRSATFALGFFQGLARRQLVRYVDYISTVSGGGYFGAFLGRLFTRTDYVRGIDDVEAILRCEHRSGIVPSGRMVMRFLRENGRYLSPNGAGDMLLGGAVVLRNLVSVHVALAVLVLLVLVGLQLVYRIAHAVEPFAALLHGVAGGIGLAVSPYLYLAALVLALSVVPTGWAYWLVGHARPVPWNERVANWGPPVILMLIGVFAAGALVGNDLRWWLWPLALIGAIATVTLLLAIVLETVQRRAGNADGSDASRHLNLVRNRVSRWHKGALLVLAVLIAVAFIDGLGAALYLTLWQMGWPAGISGAILVGLLEAVRRTATRLSARTGERPSLPVSVVGGALAVAMVLVYLLLMAAIAHAVGGGHAVLAPESGIGAPGLRAASAAAAVLLVLVLCAGRSLTFLNRSGHHALYKARLARAYLGASNALRHQGGDASVLDVQPGDDVLLEEYFRWHRTASKDAERARLAAPLHLINVTVNETIDGRSQVEQRDRKGNLLAFGPCAVSLGVHHHAVFTAAAPAYGKGCTVTVFPEDGYRVFDFPDTERGDDACAVPVEALSLGSAVAISGAAFTTGIGSRTSLALSLLCAMANVRLGYWWNSGIHWATRSHTVWTRIALWRRALTWALPMYSFLLGEALARFRGTAWQHWYLSDGGHFENLGGYELIRRRLPLIVLLDAEADPDYTFGGLAGLVRKARIDFGADIRFLDADELAGHGLGETFGTLEELRRYAHDVPATTLEGESAPSYSRRHFALASIRYDDEPDEVIPRWLIYVKPTLTGAEPADLSEYMMAHRSFPHEPTSDQFFDENQWESYRALGEHLAAKLCDAPTCHPCGWNLAQLFDAVSDPGKWNAARAGADAQVATPNLT